MPLIPCPTCGKNVSSGAESCPHCGDPLVDDQGCCLGATIIVLLTAVGCVIFLWWSGVFHGDVDYPF